MRDFLSEMLYALTSAYTRKDYDNCQRGSPLQTNIGKLFSILAWGLNMVQEQTERIRLWDNIDNAQGLVLDRYGANFGVQRYGTDDSYYRLTIKVKVLSQLSGGDNDTILNAAAALFDISVENIGLIELLPAKIRIDIHETDLTSEKIIMVAKIAAMLRRLVAAGVGMILRMYCRYFYLVCIRYDNCLTMLSSFYPRVNITELFLDESVYLDGLYLLNGYKNPQNTKVFYVDGEEILDGRHNLNGFKDVNILDFYPLRLLIKGSFQKNILSEECIKFLYEFLLSTYTESIFHMNSRFYPRRNLPLLLLNGDAELKGEYLLNGSTNELLRLDLNGEATLDGEHFLNGYGGNPNYEFYPVKLQVLEKRKVQINLSGKIYSQANVKVFVTSNLGFAVKNGFCIKTELFSHLYLCGNIRQTVELKERSSVFSKVPVYFKCEPNYLSIKMEENVGTKLKNTIRVFEKIKEQILTGREHITVEKNLWYLDGKHNLNETIRLDADIYEEWL